MQKPQDAPDLDGARATGNLTIDAIWRAMTPLRMCKCAGSSDMARVAIITDSSADLPPEVALRAGITVVPLTGSVVSALPANASARAGGRWAGQRVVRPELRGAFLEA